MVYRLTYFDVAGRAEVIRLLFVLAGVTFQDTRVQPANWPNLQPSTPWGSMPFLDDNGKVLAQTIPIIHYLGHKFGFSGNGIWEEALVLSVCEASNDLFSELSKVTSTTNLNEKKAAAKKFAESLKKTAVYFEKFITEHGKNNFTVGDEMSSADVCVFNIFNEIDGSDVLDGVNYGNDRSHPGIVGVYGKVKNNPRIASYLKSRKPSQSA